MYRGLEEKRVFLLTGFLQTKKIFLYNTTQTMKQQSIESMLKIFNCQRKGLSILSNNFSLKRNISTKRYKLHNMQTNRTIGAYTICTCVRKLGGGEGESLVKCSFKILYIFSILLTDIITYFMTYC